MRLLQRPYLRMTCESVPLTVLAVLAVLAVRWRIQLLSVSSGVFFFISFRICCRSASACDRGC